MECPICYAHIALEDEAYTNPCFHRFCLKAWGGRRGAWLCINTWTDAQRRHPPAGAQRPPLPTCPVCRRPYTQVIYDVDGVTFRSHAVGTADGAGAAPQPGGALQLDAGQRRRRSLYLNAAAAAGGGAACRGARGEGGGGGGPGNGRSNGGGDGGSSGGDGGGGGGAHRGSGAPPGRPRLPPRGPGDPEVAAWIRRELQALMLEPSVELWQQQLLGVLRACWAPAPGGAPAAGRGAPAGRGAGARRGHALGAPARGAAAGAPRATGYGQQQECLARLEAAARAPLGDHAPAFARELWRFLGSGLTVAAHDDAVFGRPRKRRRRLSDADGGSSGAGGGAGGGGRGGGGGSSGDEDSGGGGGRLWAAYGEDLAGGDY
ncbi:hypothetical protein Rsub_12457 [Raphidocelis subcapitata]|uniref:RING-type domain-containing protein n=1 Tax=Raphidocelis subcapitata TaxID=307507 RepID=A0A2V0PH59_9CHLO|nr:hypothetical protein Rsub_12457 [Raphidocelis subcapitata]|eukprot:GBF99198.1 hypothetical protein Rsub_12457 [Raphidocelis subcapitata]